MKQYDLCQSSWSWRRLKRSISSGISSATSYSNSPGGQLRHGDEEGGEVGGHGEEPLRRRRELPLDRPRLPRRRRRQQSRFRLRGGRLGRDAVLVRFFPSLPEAFSGAPIGVAAAGPASANQRQGRRLEVDELEAHGGMMRELRAERGGGNGDGGRRRGGVERHEMEVVVVMMMSFCRKGKVQNIEVIKVQIRPLVHELSRFDQLTRSMTRLDSSSASSFSTKQRPSRRNHG